MQGVSENRAPLPRYVYSSRVLLQSAKPPRHASCRSCVVGLTSTAAALTHEHKHTGPRSSTRSSEVRDKHIILSNTGHARAARRESGFHAARSVHKRAEGHARLAHARVDI